MASITGTIRIGEANAACMKIGARQRGSMLWVVLPSIALGLGVVVLADLIQMWVNVDIGIPYAFLAIFAAFPVSYFALRKIGVWRFRKQMTGKGLPLEMPVRMVISEDGLAYDLADVQACAKWSAVSELFRAHGYWIFLVQALPWFAPDRLFASEDEKRAFIAEALGYMSEAARGRSKEAVRFAEGA